MFPLRAFNRFRGENMTGGRIEDDAKAAQTVQAQIGIRF
jgi:hypothetical protein